MSNEQKTQFSINHTRVVGLGASAVAVFINLIVLFFATILLDIPRDFPPLNGIVVLFFTILGTLFATVAFIIISRFSKKPIRTFQLVAVVAMILSILPNLAIILNPSEIQSLGVAPLALWVLILFHVLTAAVCIWFFSTMTQEI